MQWVRQLLWPRSSLYGFDIAPEARQLPLQVVDRSHRRKAALFAAMAVCCAVPFIMAWSGIPVGQPPGLLIWLAIFGSGTALFAVLALHKLLLHTSWEFGPDGVRCDRSYLFWRRSWDEPWSSYVGVVAEEQISTRKSRADPLLLLLLKHRANEKRSVLLYASFSRKDTWEKQKHYASLFTLPALIDTGLGLDAQAAEDLGKSLRQRVAEGRVQPRLLPSASPPGKNLLAEVRADALILTSRKGASMRAATVASAVVMALDIVTTFILSSLTVVVIGGVIVACAIIAAMIVLHLFREELEISPQGVRKRWRHPWGVSWESMMAADEVEQVSVRTSEKQSGSDIALWIVGAGRAMEFSAAMTVPEMNWVRDCIIAVIGK